VAVALTWPKFLLSLLALDLLINLLFAMLYLIVPGCVSNVRPGALTDAFFFSLETLATVGYGAMAPATLYGHLVASAEIISGMAFTAIVTGLMFVRFSRPKARIVYAERAVIATHNGTPTLMVRIANARLNVLTNALVQMVVVQAERTAEGVSFRRGHELRLVRPNLQVFALTWTLMHEIDEQSPLHDLGAAKVSTKDLQLFLTLEAYDPILAATVRDVKAYRASDILFGRRYADAILVSDGENPVADLTRVSATEPDLGSQVAAPF
jgi:inward rectifier potassium channel